MPQLQVGWQIFHNGLPVQLLYLKEKTLEGEELWRVKPLFVVEPDRDELIGPHDRISFLHTIRVKGVA